MELQDPYPRFLASAAREALADTPIVVLQGARQVGKSTLAQALAREVDRARQVTLDDPVTLAVAREDPVFFVEQAGTGLLLVDEAQRAPGLILPLKASVDRDRRPGRFLLTGSADLLQVKGVGDSLAGRAETLELKTLSQGEVARRRSPEDFVSWVLSGEAEHVPVRRDGLDPDMMVRGGYPEVQHRDARRAHRWFSSYVERLADHDASELQAGGYAAHMRQLLGVIAAGGQQELVKAKVARALGIGEGTIERYLQLASTMRLVRTLPAWTRTPRGRVARRPKVSLHDTGLSAHLTGFTGSTARSIGGREYYGALAEQFVALELERQRGWSAEVFTLSHFRDLDGLEVDLVIELSDGRLLAVEVKSGATVTERSWANLRRFRARHRDRDIRGVCLHGGVETALIDGWLHVLPIPRLWQH